MMNPLCVGFTFRFKCVVNWSRQFNSNVKRKNLQEQYDCTGTVNIRDQWWVHRWEDTHVQKTKTCVDDSMERDQESQQAQASQIPGRQEPKVNKDEEGEHPATLTQIQTVNHTHSQLYCTHGYLLKLTQSFMVLDYGGKWEY